MYNLMDKLRESTFTCAKHILFRYVVSLSYPNFVRSHWIKNRAPLNNPFIYVGRSWVIFLFNCPFARQSSNGEGGGTPNELHQSLNDESHLHECVWPEFVNSSWLCIVCSAVAFMVIPLPSQVLVSLLKKHLWPWAMDMYLCAIFNNFLSGAHM